MNKKGGDSVQKFARYLINHIVLDFDGDITMEMVNAMLLEDGGQVAHDLRAKLLAEGGANDFLLVLADCLKEFLHEGITEDLVKDQVAFYLDA